MRSDTPHGGDVEDLPEVGTDRVLVDLGHLRKTVAGTVDQATLPACTRG